MLDWGDVRGVGVGRGGPMREGRGVGNMCGGMESGVVGLWRSQKFVKEVRKSSKFFFLSLSISSSVSFPSREAGLGCNLRALLVLASFLMRIRGVKVV